MFRSFGWLHRIRQAGTWPTGKSEVAVSQWRFTVQVIAWALPHSSGWKEPGTRDEVRFRLQNNFLQAKAHLTRENSMFRVCIGQKWYVYIFYCGVSCYHEIVCDNIQWTRGHVGPMHTTSLILFFIEETDTCLGGEGKLSRELEEATRKAREVLMSWRTLKRRWVCVVYPLSLLSFDTLWI